MSVLMPADITNMVIHRSCFKEYTAECGHAVDLAIPDGRIIRIQAMPLIQILTLLATLSPDKVDNRAKCSDHFSLSPGVKLLDPIKLIRDISIKYLGSS